MHNYLILSFVSYNPIWSSLHPQTLAHRCLFFVPDSPCHTRIFYEAKHCCVSKRGSGLSENDSSPLPMNSTWFFESNWTRKPYWENKEKQTVALDKLWGRHFCFLVPTRPCIQGPLSQSPWSWASTLQIVFPYGSQGLCASLCVTLMNLGSFYTALVSVWHLHGALWFLHCCCLQRIILLGVSYDFCVLKCTGIFLPTNVQLFALVLSCFFFFSMNHLLSLTVE